MEAWSFDFCGLFQFGKVMPELPDGLVFDLPSNRRMMFLSMPIW